MATQAARELDEIPKRTKGEGEEDSAEGGSKGRFSAGGEVYFSAKQRSFGSEYILYSTVYIGSLSTVWLITQSLPESDIPPSHNIHQAN